MSASTPAVKMPPVEPWLFRLALKLFLGEVKKRPKTLLVFAINVLVHGHPIPDSAPFLFRLVLELLQGQVANHPHTLLARVVEELRKVAEEMGDPTMVAQLQKIATAMERNANANNAG